MTHATIHTHLGTTLTVTSSPEGHGPRVVGIRAESGGSIGVFTFLPEEAIRLGNALVTAGMAASVKPEGPLVYLRIRSHNARDAVARLLGHEIPERWRSPTEDHWYAVTEEEWSRIEAATGRWRSSVTRPKRQPAPGDLHLCWR
jgi:hypothetical protein